MFHVRFVDGEKAVAQLAIRREPDAITVQAEWLAHRSDEAHPSTAVGVLVFRRRRARIAVGYFDQRANLTRDGPDDLVRRQNLAATPQRLRVERHELYVPRLKATLAAIARHGNDIGFHQ